MGRWDPSAPTSIHVSLHGWSVEGAGGAVGALIAADLMSERAAPFRTYGSTPTPEAVRMSPSFAPAMFRRLLALAALLSFPACTADHPVAPQRASAPRQ